MNSAKALTGGQSGAVVVVQRTSSDLKFNPHLHIVFLDGVYRELDAETAGFTALPHLSTREVGEVLETIRKRISSSCAAVGCSAMVSEHSNAEGRGRRGTLVARGVGRLGTVAPGRTRVGRRSVLLPALVAQPLGFDKPLCASKDGFTLHAATRAGALDPAGREALCKYVLRPAIAQERITHGPDGLVRIALKRAVLRRHRRHRPRPALAALPPGGLRAAPEAAHRALRRGSGSGQQAARAHRAHARRCAGQRHGPSLRAGRQSGGSRYRPWAELLKRTFGSTFCSARAAKAACSSWRWSPSPRSIQRMLRHVGEPTEPPVREPARGPPYWKSRVLRRSA